MLDKGTQWRVSVVAGIATLVAVAAWLIDGGSVVRGVMVACWALWVVAPPIFFLWEWACFPHDPETEWNGEGRSFASFKYSQELASKVWIAGATVLSVLLLSESAIRSTTPQASSREQSRQADARQPVRR